MTEPVWLQTARRHEGLTEIPGERSNATILQMAREIGAPSWFHNDDQPWCAVFQNWVLLESEIAMAIGVRGDQFDRLRAATFLQWGVGLAGPALGAICVFSRPSGGHVGMYLGERGNVIRVYGGNQGNKVCATWIHRERLRGYRWPLKVALPPIAPVLLTANGKSVSVNEA